MRIVKYGDPCRVRTCNPQIRSLVLYPVELRGQKTYLPYSNRLPPIIRIANNRFSIKLIYYLINLILL